MGRLKKHIRVNGKNFVCKDVNLDSDFIIYFTIELMSKLGLKYEDSKIQYKKYFDDEKITRVEFNMEYAGEQYGIVITRNTFSHKILIGCEILAKDDNLELFGSAYELKVKLIELYNKICENSNIFYLEDYNNEKICQSAYTEIYEVEVKFRNILTKYLMKKYGSLVFSNPIKGEVDKFSKWFRKSTGKYSTFKRINTDYCNLDFNTLPQLLNLKDSQIINFEGSNLTDEVEQLIKLFEDEANVSDVYYQVLKIKELDNKRRRYVFNDKISEDLRSILDDRFVDVWVGKLSQMRNMVAHNKPICKELYYDIIETCKWVNDKFNKCINFIEIYFYTDEEGVLSAIEDIARREEQDDIDYIKNEREFAGIDIPLSIDYIETMLIEDNKAIQRFMSNMYKLNDMRKIIEDIECFIHRFSDVEEKIYMKNKSLRSKAFSIIKNELNLKEDFAEFDNLPIYEIVKRLLFNKVDIEKSIEFYTDNNKYPSNTFKFECFDMDYDIGWYGIDNKEYRITFDGILSPENGWEDELKFKLYIDKEKIKTYYLKIYYGDYLRPSQFDIDDTQVYYLIEDVENCIRDTVDSYKKIHDISMKLMDLI